MLEAGKRVYELAPRQSTCFESIVSGEDVGQLSLGLPVRIRFDAYDYQKHGTINGTVSFISPDSKPIDGTAAPERSNNKQNSPMVFTVRIQLHAVQSDRRSLQAPLKLGLTGTAEIITDRESLLNVLLKRIRRTISLI